VRQPAVHAVPHDALAAAAPTPAIGILRATRVVTGVVTGIGGDPARQDRAVGPSARRRPAHGGLPGFLPVDCRGTSWIPAGSSAETWCSKQARGSARLPRWPATRLLRVLEIGS
jgi:hypothetical protein